MVSPRRLCTFAVDVVTTKPFVREWSAHGHPRPGSTARRSSVRRLGRLRIQAVNTPQIDRPRCSKTSEGSVGSVQRIPSRDPGRNSAGRALAKGRGRSGREHNGGLSRRPRISPRGSRLLVEVFDAGGDPARLIVRVPGVPVFRLLQGLRDSSRTAGSRGLGPVRRNPLARTSFSRVWWRVRSSRRACRSASAWSAANCSAG